MQRVALSGLVLSLTAVLACGRSEPPAVQAPAAPAPVAVPASPSVPGVATPVAPEPPPFPLPPMPAIAPPPPASPAAPVAPATNEVRGSAPGDDDWITCAAEGDQRCVIRSLAPRPRLNARELSTLIEAYRAMSDTPHMCAAMRDFVTRFEDHASSRAHRQVLAARCGGVAPVTQANDDWIACAAQGDHRCVIRSLAPRPRLNAHELGTLIEAYRALSDTRNRCAAMRNFVERFPVHPSTARHRQVLAARCGGL